MDSTHYFSSNIQKLFCFFLAFRSFKTVSRERGREKWNLLDNTICHSLKSFPDFCSYQKTTLSDILQKAILAMHFKSFSNSSSLNEIVSMFFVFFSIKLHMNSSLQFCGFLLLCVMCVVYYGQYRISHPFACIFFLKPRQRRMVYFRFCLFYFKFHVQR